VGFVVSEKVIMSHQEKAGAEWPCGRRDGQWSLSEIEADFARRDARQRRRLLSSGLTRREFLALAAAGAAAGAAAAAWPKVGQAGLPPTVPLQMTPPPPVSLPAASTSSSAALTPTASPASAAAPVARSRVVVVTHDPKEIFIKDYRANPLVIRRMLERALVELFGVRTEAQGWLKVAHEGDLVALKHNSIGRPTLESHTEINDAVSAQLAAEAKVDPRRIVVVDRTLPAAYAEFSDPFTLPTRGLQTRLRRLYTDHATAIVNVSILKSHYGEGLSEAMKNHLGSINNPSAYHGWEADHLPRNVPELNLLEPLRTKTRLVVIDALRPLFAGGPSDNPDYRWDYGGLVVSTDPVAASAVGLRIVEARRAEFHKGEWPLAAARLMMAHAQSIGLGNADANRIDLAAVKLA
jgi:hypothetical protein